MLHNRVSTCLCIMSALRCSSLRQRASKERNWCRILIGGIVPASHLRGLRLQSRLASKPRMCGLVFQFLPECMPPPPPCSWCCARSSKTDIIIRPINKTCISVLQSLWACTLPPVTLQEKSKFSTLVYIKTLCGRVLVPCFKTLPFVETSFVPGSIFRM